MSLQKNKGIFDSLIFKNKNEWTYYRWALYRAIAILTIVWGAFEHGVKLFDSDFMSYAVGGLVCLIISLLMISFVPSSVTIVVIGLTALSSMLYIYGFDEVDLILKLMSLVPILGFTTWLILHLMN